MTRRLAGRLVACSLAVALATGTASSAAANGLRTADPRPDPPTPTAPPSDNERYCKQDPDWYLCQHPRPPH